jgi:hypothetical protein
MHRTSPSSTSTSSAAAADDGSRSAATAAVGSEQPTDSVAAASSGGADAGEGRDGTGSGGRCATAVSSKQCSMCIDALVNPTAVPCGHIFCWTCIVTYMRSPAAAAAAASQSQSQSQLHPVGGSTARSGIGSGGSHQGTGRRVKCPVCRTEFLEQKLLLLHNFE